MKLLQHNYILLSLIAVMIIIPLVKISKTRDTPASITTLPKPYVITDTLLEDAVPAAYYDVSNHSWSFSAQVVEIRDVSIYGRPGTIAKIETRYHLDNGWPG